MSRELKVTVVPQALGGQEVTAVPAAHLSSAQLLVCTVVSSRAGSATALLSQNTAGSRIAQLSQVILESKGRSLFLSCLLSSRCP